MLIRKPRRRRCMAVGERRRVTLATRAWVGETLVVDGEALVLAPG